MRIKKLLAAVALAATAVVGLALPASAHHVNSITVNVNCQGYSGSASLNVFDNHSYRVTAPGFSTGFVTEPGSNHNVTVPFSGTATNGTVVATIYNGANGTGGVEATQSRSFYLEQDCREVVEVAPPIRVRQNCDHPGKVTVDRTQKGIDVVVTGSLTGPGVVTIDFSAKPGFVLAQGTKTHYSFKLGGKLNCTPPAHFAPAASFTGPCGDPMYRANLNNRRSNRAVTFVVRYFKFGSGWATIRRTVHAGVRVSTSYFHVLGGTKMTVSARGKVLRSATSAPGGNYPACG